jgi:glutamate-1-semialdehyde 2,1-aminomutase
MFFVDEPVTDYETAKAADAKRYARFFHALLERGVYFAPSAFETLFPSMAHTDADLEATATAASEAAMEVAAAG